MYKKLRYEQYFTDTSSDYNETGKARYPISYTDIAYHYRGKVCHVNYEVHYEKEREVIQINFEQTSGWDDWFVNLMFTSKYYDAFTWNNKKIKLKVHNGWAAMYKAVKMFVTNEFLYWNELYPRAEVEIIGWSLGSAQAMLCAQDLNFNYGVKCHLFTYGSVNPFRVNIFNRRKIKAYLNSCCKEVYNFSDKNDLISYLPPRIFGFTKINRVNTVGRFCPLKLIEIDKYHTHYDEEGIYRKVYKKDKKG